MSQGRDRPGSNQGGRVRRSQLSTCQCPGHPWLTASLLNQRRIDLSAAALIVIVSREIFVSYDAIIGANPHLPQCGCTSGLPHTLSSQTVQVLRFLRVISVSP